MNLKTNKVTFLRSCNIGLMLIIAIVIVGCSLRMPYEITVMRKKLPIKNPTVYIFNATVEQTRNVIKKIDFSFFTGISLCKWGGYTYFYEELAKDTSNINDFFLVFGPQAITHSLMYCSQNDGEPLEYFASFHLHILEIDSRRTMVQIITLDSRVKVGQTSGLFEVHGPTLISQEVPPSTIEEYQILLKIGEKLGVKDKMPPLLLPK